MDLLTSWGAFRYRYAPTLFVLIALVLCFGCEDSPQPESDAIASLMAAKPRDDASIRRFCGDCHAMPDPGSFPKGRWKHEVEQGLRIYRQSGRSDLVEPDLQACVDYFSRRAPERYQFDSDSEELDTSFRAITADWSVQNRSVAISSTLRVPRDDGPDDLILTDIWTGAITRVSRLPQGIRGEQLARVVHPAHIEAADLNADGLSDFVVADLGSLSPQDEREGSLWLLEAQRDGGYRTRPLLMGLSRVADVRPLDFDDDGDLDLAVADFGLHFTGAILLLVNEGVSNGVPQFSRQTIDQRPGGVELKIVDFDGNGREDIMALISQHHESVELYLNQPNGTFVRKQIYKSDNPAYGSSGFEVVDFDGDSDLDVVYTNGDTFDDDLAKPYHGVQWLENRGDFPFEHHLIGKLPGAYCAVTGDIDLDGDLDVAAVSLLTPAQISDHPDVDFAGVVWFEQLSDRRFRRHRMRDDACTHATCRLVDWDGDGDLDLLAPNYTPSLEPNATATVYENLKVSTGDSSITVSTSSPPPADG